MGFTGGIAIRRKEGSGQESGVPGWQLAPLRLSPFKCFSPANVKAQPSALKRQAPLKQATPPMPQLLTADSTAMYDSYVAVAENPAAGSELFTSTKQPLTPSKECQIRASTRPLASPANNREVFPKDESELAQMIKYALPYTTINLGGRVFDLGRISDGKDLVFGNENVELKNGTLRLAENTCLLVHMNGIRLLQLVIQGSGADDKGALFIVSQAKGVTVKGCKLQLIESLESDNEEVNVAVVEQGSDARFSDCVLQGLGMQANSSGLDIKGDGTRVGMERCRVHDNKNGSMFVDNAVVHVCTTYLERGELDEGAVHLNWGASRAYLLACDVSGALGAEARRGSA